MHINKTGTDVESFKDMFSDGQGAAFHHALIRSFAFAFQVIEAARKAHPSHRLELWDQAVQYKLDRICQAEDILVDDATLHFEKQESSVVWQYGVVILKSERKSKKRLWTLPDGAIKIGNQVIALELDHGGSVGNWARQLLKAVRSCASRHVDGLLYCFCMEGKPHSSGPLVGEQDAFTDEFLSLIDAGLFGKKLGMITAYPAEWRDTSHVGVDEIIKFFEAMYIAGKKSSTSRNVAQEIVSELAKAGQNNRFDGS